MKLGDLCSLSNEALLARLRTCVGVERRVLAKLVAFLAGGEGRGIHRENGYSPLQGLCMRAFGMSEGEAFRRMNAARLALRFPGIPRRIERGEIHLSGLVLVRDLLLETRGESILDEA